MKFRPEEHAMVQALIDETYGRFTNVVPTAARRHQKNNKEGKALADQLDQFRRRPRVVRHGGAQTWFRGRTRRFDDAVERAKKIAGIGNANLIEYRERYDISNFLSMFGQSGQAHDIKLDLGVDMPKLQAGQLYFLSHLCELT
jgi:hypothetical protein